MLSFKTKPSQKVPEKKIGVFQEARLKNLDIQIKKTYI